MQSLGNDIIIKVALLIVLICGVVIGNIYIATCRKRNWLSLSVHLVSLFFCMFLLCIFLQVVIISDLQIKNIYESVGNVSLVISLILALWMSFLLLRNKIFFMVGTIPEFSGILTTLEDITIIADYQGKIVEFNIPQEQIDFRGRNCHTLDELERVLKEMAQGEVMEQATEFEVYDPLQKKYYKVSKASIKGKRWNGIGTILLLHEITLEKSLNEEIERNNTFLEEANTKLLHYVEVACELENEKERLELLEKIQAALISDIEKVLVKLNPIEKSEAVDITIQKRASQIADELRLILLNIRGAVRSMADMKEAH